MNRPSRIVTGLMSLAAAAAVSVAVPATASANTPGTSVPPCGVTGAYAWQDTCDPIARPSGDR
jgi:hypothetical protein